MKLAEPIGYAYRFEDKGYGEWDEYGERWYYIGMKVTLHTFAIERETPCGFWISAYLSRKFILNKAVKKYAHRTKEKALESFIARKKRQIDIYDERLGRAKEALKIAEAMKQKEEDNANQP